MNLQLHDFDISHEHSHFLVHIQGFTIYLSFRFILPLLCYVIYPYLHTNASRDDLPFKWELMNPIVVYLGI